MVRPPAPWWMYLFAASFLACFSVVIYNDLWGSEPPGISGEYLRGGMFVTKVQPASAAERAGLAAGDHITSIDAQHIQNIADWMGIQTNLDVGTEHELEIERGHERLQSTLNLGQQHPLKHWDASGEFSE
jgi:S1-C subfamily serine protease